jgi:hypothetical protein
MTGEAHWLTLAVLFVVALPVAYLWFRSWREERKYIVEESHVRCRARGNQLAECTLVRDAKTREPIGIRECSARATAASLDCGKTCLPLFKSSGSTLVSA